MRVRSNEGTSAPSLVSTRVFFPNKMTLRIGLVTEEAQGSTSGSTGQMSVFITDVDDRNLMKDALWMDESKTELNGLKKKSCVCKKTKF